MICLQCVQDILNWKNYERIEPSLKTVVSIPVDIMSFGMMIWISTRQAFTKMELLWARKKYQSISK